MRKKVTQFVEHLRSKPEETRRHILTWVMIVTTGLLVLVWVAMLGISAKSASPSPAAADKTISPFSLMKENFLSSFHTVADGLKGLKNDLVQSKNTVPEPAPETPISATGDTTANQTE